MDFDSFQEQAIETAIYPQSYSIIYPAMGLANEAGEVLGKVKKLIRDGTLDRDAVIAELGDVLWYLAVLSDDLGVLLSQVAQYNIDKLNSRLERGTLRGSGDNR